jgi:hypothetical protein
MTCTVDPQTGRDKTRIRCYINGFLTNFCDFAFRVGSIIYTDGSAKHIRWKGVDVASAAAYQICPDGTQLHMTIQLPRDTPQSAVAAEFMAVSIACMRMPPCGGKVIIAADCQAVVTAFQDLTRFDNYSFKFAGLFRVPGIDQIENIIKVKAHLAEHEAKEQGVHHHWFGNDKADYWAKDTLDSTGAAGVAYVKSMVQDLRRLSNCVEHICKQVPANIFKLPKVATVKNSKTKPMGNDFVKHNFVWHKNRWVCGECGCFKKGLAGKVDGKSCSSAARAISLAHPSHRLFRGWFGKGDSGVPLAFCTLCGCYSSTNLVKLKLLCAPKVGCKHKATILKRLSSKRHPISLQVVRDVQRVRHDREVIVDLFSQIDSGQLGCDVEDTQVGGPGLGDDSRDREGDSPFHPDWDDFNMACRADADLDDAADADLEWLHELGF